MLNAYESPQTLNEGESEPRAVPPKIEPARLWKFSLFCLAAQGVWVFVPLVFGEKFPGGMLALTIIGLSMMVLFVTGLVAAVLAAVFGKAVTRYIAAAISALYVFVMLVWRGLIW